MNLWKARPENEFSSYFTINFASAGAGISGAPISYHALRFAMLGSGSQGNATVVQSGDTRILVDCGFSARETGRRLAMLGIEPGKIDAILLTHEHSDHVSGAGAVARQLSVPVWMTAGTHRKAAGVLGDLAECHLFDLHDSFSIGEIEVRPYPVPHDAGEPSQFVFYNGAVKLGLLTDAGSVTRHMKEMLSGCDALILECNHDRDMLLESDYPAALKARVDGTHGHLSNDAAGALLEEIETDRLQHIVAAHLSEKNNTTWLARSTVASALNCAADWVAVADQATGLGWREIV